MSEISLRAYHRKIEGWIEDNKIDKAISQIGLLIDRFPKDLHSWQCLSKALLQKQDFKNANLVFDVIHKVDPDDFVAHIGKSMILESENSLDAAIEHMRQAFEIQPANEGLQNELKRLIQKKDGIEPNKVRLTRGALIKMYIRGGLFDQAIAEAEIGVGENPQRIDYHVALAEGYEKTGNYIKSVESCVKILGELPYCLKANEILFEILSKSPKYELAEIYRNRISGLDPYYAFKLEHTSSVLDVPDIAVMMEDFSDEPDSQINLEELITRSWEFDLDGINNKNSAVEPDWDSVIEKAVESPQIMVNLDGKDYEEVHDSEFSRKADDMHADESAQPQSRKEAFLGKLRPSMQKNDKDNIIPEWIFDPDGELVQHISENDLSQEGSDSQLSELETHYSEETGEPYYPEQIGEGNTHSVWISENGNRNSSAGNQTTVKLEDTQQIGVPDYQPVYLLDIAEKAIAGENYQYAISLFRKIINQGDYIEDVIRRLEGILAEFPENSELLLLLGELYTRQGKRAEALAVYKKAQKNISL